MDTENHKHIGSNVDISRAKAQIDAHPELWDTRSARTTTVGSPHVGTHDIWIRGSEKISDYGIPHDSKWLLPESQLLSEVKPLVFGLMHYVQGTRLGGVLLYKLKPGESIGRHVDDTWHPRFYDKKFNICISSNPNALFHYEGDAFSCKAGDIHYFRNDVPHWLNNDGDTDYTIIVVCLKQE